MDEALGQSGQEVEEGRDEEEEEERGTCSRERAGNRGEKRRREREDPFLKLIKEDIQYQREADERREAEARERSNRFFLLLERLAEK